MMDSLVCAEDTFRKPGKQSQVQALNIHAKLKVQTTHMDSTPFTLNVHKISQKIYMEF